MSKELADLVTQEVLKKLGETKAEPQAQVRNMDSEEILNLENLQQKETIESQRIEMEKMRAALVRLELNSLRDSMKAYFYNKYGVNPTTHRLSIDSKEKTVEIEPIL